MTVFDTKQSQQHVKIMNIALTSKQVLSFSLFDGIYQQRCMPWWSEIINNDVIFAVLEILLQLSF